MKKLSLAVMMFALMAFLVACGTDNEKADKTTSSDGNTESEVIEVTHELDKKPVEVKKSPETVVVFDFGILDTLDELGIEVAGLPQATIPAYLSKFEDAKYKNLGSLKEPDFEAIHAMKPDVIFISGRQADLYKEFSEIAPTIFVGLDTAHYMDSFKENMDLVAKIFDKEDEMKTELAEIDEQIAAINDKTSNFDENALIVLGSEGKVSAYGPNSRFGLIHDVFGFKAADEKIEVSTHGQNVTFEYIVETNPDILFVVDRDAAIGTESSVKDSIENDLVKKTDAYKNGKIIYLNADYWYLSGGGLLSMKEMINEMEEAF
ncbi:siderophore ABC transporter substrate-binding protein [Sporosarcina sp. Marseille-Q4063]|uniref:siderophore ABC transporter substrate-binding protein n=1 Tax=Sporosarcina sp. Marseille-Q4063 TaxID=2810514 RepID=UPI001BAEBE50|nr:siderophore ABC transporter substrate-binding protein [Sporosarcina sp. Marseille-Q4063]QUW23957.1 siderophore ABC transporter substrate-binding protein [Sporosarcina sp. Marseille-Q4063]